MVLRCPEKYPKLSGEIQLHYVRGNNPKICREIISICPGKESPNVRENIPKLSEEISPQFKEYLVNFW